MYWVPKAKHHPKHFMWIIFSNISICEYVLVLAVPVYKFKNWDEKILMCPNSHS